MRTLFVMRHCKSRWDQGNVQDIDRKLSARGKRDAQDVGRQLALDAPPPDLIVTSTARRARATAKRVAKAWGYSARTTKEPRLYDATRQSCVSLLRALDESVESVMIVGHNPCLEELVFFLGDRAVQMATGTVARIDLPIDSWQELRLPADGTVARVWNANRDPS